MSPNVHEYPKMPQKASDVCCPPFDEGFNQLCYSSDGEYLLAGGKSFLVVMYSVRARHVIGTFILSQNMNIDGLQEFLNSKNTMTEFGALADIDDDEQVKIAGQKKKDFSYFILVNLYLLKILEDLPWGPGFLFKFVKKAIKRMEQLIKNMPARHGRTSVAESARHHPQMARETSGHRGELRCKKRQR